MTARFAGKSALVTGGGSGIGQAIALALAREGARVTVGGRRQAALQDTLDRARAEGLEVGATRVDVTDRGGVARMVERAAAGGPLDVAINNAGIIRAGAPVGDIDDDSWHETMATNLTGVFYCMREEIATMREAGGGVIVNIASLLGAHMRLPGMGALIAAKAAVSALTRTAAREYAGDGIRINAISPGPIDTPTFRQVQASLVPGESDSQLTERFRTILPVGRVGSVTEVAAAVLWLASPESAFVLGQDLVIDGGGSA
jgi:NAD(P)-dependent dehydrogenase (short-subunit alcohol dehydrogenase family)